MTYTLTEEQYEALMERTRHLEKLVRDLADLSGKMMDACASDDPRLDDLPHFKTGRAMLADIEKYMRN